MKKLLILFFALACALSSFAQSDFSMTVLAGSNAPWGKTQYLHIDAKGKCSYMLSEVNSNNADSSSFVITRAELKQVTDAITKERFYSLKEEYNSGASDGRRLFVAVTSNKKTHSVQLFNEHISEMTVLLTKLNSVLEAYKIHINY